jgi:hypothetical protein
MYQYNTAFTSDINAWTCKKSREGGEMNEQSQFRSLEMAAVAILRKNIRSPCGAITGARLQEQPARPQRLPVTR